MAIGQFLRIPLQPPRPSALQRAFLRAGRGIVACPVCGRIARIRIDGENLRETCACKACGASNRQRQIAYVVCALLSQERGRPVRSLRALWSLQDPPVVYNTESSGALHEHLARVRGYRSSEYFGPQHRSGEIVGGFVHQDLMDLEMEDATVDLVISADVFEHIPDPYEAHREVHRILRRSGRHVFTVPFHAGELLDERRAALDGEGRNVYFKEPVYHFDPLRPEGILVYNVFALEMLVELARIGFRTNVYQLSDAARGILGPNAIVFEAMKP